MEAHLTSLYDKIKFVLKKDTYSVVFIFEMSQFPFLDHHVHQASLPSIFAHDSLYRPNRRHERLGR